jgi:hypothetical protein
VERNTRGKSGIYWLGGRVLETPQTKSYHIQELYEWFTRNELVLNPSFQRRDVWPDKARSFLVDTILCGMPIPKIFMRQKINVAAKKSQREVVDGQQRLRAIFDYINGKFTVMRAHNSEFADLEFSELPEDVQERFLSYQISTDLLVGASDEDVLEIFSRINSFSAPLNAFELFNAQYFGLFKRTVFRLGREHLEFWKKNGILTDKRITRMGEAALAADLVAVMLTGINNTTKSSMKKLFEKYDDEFPQLDQVVEDFRHVINSVAFLFPDGLAHTKFSTITNFYSLFVLLHSLEHSVPGLPKYRLAITAKNADRIQEALLAANTVLENPDDYPEFSAFVEASTRRTTHMISRKQRHEFLLGLVKGDIHVEEP